MRQIRLANTEEFVPAIGQGTWRMGEDPQKHRQEVEALRVGIEAGMTLIDTAEMYADGGAERVVADAIADCRENVFVVTKVWPSNASYEETIRAAERSRKRLRIECIDLYLLHWPSRSTPVEETMRAMKTLVRDGLIRHVGVSNFSVELMARAQEALGDLPLVANQLPLHLRRRIIEKEILPYCNTHQTFVMAYTPLGRGDFLEPGSPDRQVLEEIGREHGCTPHQVALGWVISRQGVIAIPKASSIHHVRENAAAGALQLSPEALDRLDRHFPLPEGEYEVSWKE